MTAPRRALVLLVAAAGVGPLPACLSVSAPAVPITPPDWKPPKSSGFAELPPGTKVATNPGTKSPPADAADPGRPPTHVAGRNPKPDPEAPPPPDGFHPVKAEPNPLPLIPGPPTPEPPLLAAMRAHAEGRPDRAIECLQSLDKPNQDFVLAVLPALVRGAQMNPDTAAPEDVAVLVEQLQAAAARLEPRAALRVDKVTFCKRVRGFGRYDPWPEAQPYRPNDLAELYVEVRHATSEPAAGPNGEAFVTRLASTLEVRDANGRLVEQTDPADWRRRVPVARFERTDHSRSPVRDYFIKYTFPVPTAPGVYTVTVEVKDPAGNRAVKSKPAEFRVAGP